VRGAPKSFLEAMLKARFRAFVAARDATLDGDDDKGGRGAAIGAGGKVILFVSGEDVLG